MKKMKRILTLMLTVCLMLPCFSTVSYAADGVIFFDDLETSVGATFTINGTVVAKNDTIGDATVEMTYDTSYLKFVSGDGVTLNSAGSLTYAGSGDGSSDRIEFAITFQALQEGSTRMEQGTASVTNEDGETVACESGYSDISIGEGDPSLLSAGSIEVNGVSYDVASTFSDTLIPNGFVRSDITYQDTTYTGILHEATGIQGLYLTSLEGISSFYLYNQTDDSFYPCEEIMISDEYTLIVLAETDGVDMGNDYVDVDFAINGVDFPAWYSPERDGFYVIYGLSSATGEKTLYLYDSTEHTYQRMETPEQQAEETTEVVAKSSWDKLSDFIVDNLIWVVVGVTCVLIVFIILLIVLAVKLRHRNLELDDLYDEYGIDLEESPEKNIKDKAPIKESFANNSDDKYLEYYEEDEYEDDEYEYEEDEYEDEEDEYEASDNDFYEAIDDLADLRNEFSSTPAKTSKNYDEYYDDDDFEDYEEDEYDGESDLKQSVNTDTFEMDFIEFD